MEASRRGAIGVATLAAAASIIAVALVSGAGGTASPAFAVDRIADGTLAVRIVNSAASAKTMTKQLRDAGLDVSVTPMPVSRQLVGTWLAESFSADVPAALRQQVTAQTTGYVSTVQLPATFPGTITLYIGRAAEAGEQIWSDGRRNALAPGGLLACLNAPHETPERVASAAEQYGYSVTWADGDGLDLKTISAPRDVQQVVNAFVDEATPTEVQLVVASPGSTRFSGRAELGFAPVQWQGQGGPAGSCTRAG